MGPSRGAGKHTAVVMERGNQEIRNVTTRGGTMGLLYDLFIVPYLDMEDTRRSTHGSA